MKKKIVLAILMSSVLLHLYPSYGTVVKVQPKKDKSDIVWVQDVYGCVHRFDDADDLNKGDKVSMIMFDNFTTKVRDDTILKIRCVG